MMRAVAANRSASSPWPESHSRSPSRSIRPRCRRLRLRAPSVRCTARGCRRGQRCLPPSPRHRQPGLATQGDRASGGDIGPSHQASRQAFHSRRGTRGAGDPRTRVARLRRRRIRAAGSLHMRKRRRDGVPRPAALLRPARQTARRRTTVPERSGPTARRQSPPAADHPNRSTARGARPPIARNPRPRHRRHCTRTSAKV